MARDYSKFAWEKDGRKSSKLPKNQFVWSVIHDYINSNNITTYSQLLAAFPNSIRDGKNGLKAYNFPLFVTLREAQIKYNKRFYDNEDKIFYLKNNQGKNEEYVVTNQWGLPVEGDYDCWSEFLNTAKLHGYSITKYNKSDVSYISAEDNSDTTVKKNDIKIWLFLIIAMLILWFVKAMF